MRDRMAIALASFALWLCCTWSPILADEAGSFYRAIKLNGPAVTIDGHEWDGQDAPRLSIKAKAFENQAVKLVPETDAERARTTRSSRWGEVEIALADVPIGTYLVWGVDLPPSGTRFSIDGRA